MTATEAATIRSEITALRTEVLAGQRDLARKVEEQITQVSTAHSECRDRCSETRTPIYDRLGKLEVSTATMAEKVANLNSRTGAIVGTATGVIVGLVTGALGTLIQHWLK